MNSKKKHITVGQERVYDQELIYASVIGVLVSSRNLNFDDVLSCELADYPPSMFCPDGQSKSGKSKVTFKKNLQVTISECNCPNADTVVYDVSALLWVLDWPLGKTSLVHLLLHFKHLFIMHSQDVNVTLVFDRYYAGSIKTHTQMQQAVSSQVHNLMASMPTAPKQ